jgi:hypothetical protein
MKLTGAKAWVFFDSFDESRVITYGNVPVLTEPNKWYFVLERGPNSNFPYEGSVIRAPSNLANQISLVAGDKIFPIEENRMCKTSASVSMEEGTVDVGDDCDPGATILDGTVGITGSLGGFFRYDDQTQEFDVVTDSIFSHFFDTIEDDGEGVYGSTERSNSPVYLLMCLNSSAKAGQIEHWLFIPAAISSFSPTLGNTEAQSRDISFSKGEGRAVHYKRPKAA